MARYWAKSIVMTRITGIPYRLNDVTLSKKSGRILFRTDAVKKIGLKDECFVMLRMPEVDGRLLMEVWEDPECVMGQHVRRVSGQENMQTYARGMVRLWCQRLKVDELRLWVTGMARLRERVTLVELAEAEDMARMYGWGSRKKQI